MVDNGDTFTNLKNNLTTEILQALIKALVNGNTLQSNDIKVKMYR